jgi:hypothetical protein
MSRRNQVRLIMLIPTFIVGKLIASTLVFCWTSFLLTEDSIQTQATIAAELSHGVVQYKYTVGDKQYVGQSQPNRERGGNTQVGGVVRVNYCPHHPSLSSLQDPVFPPSQVFLLIIALPVEFFFIATVINPKGKWALKTGLKENE